jgi:CMP-N-acetylneuraminic acid synthetase
VKILAIIPARGGSKGIPKKNITPLQGKPLIQYTIEAAQNSSHIDKVFLSSDNDEIISTAKELGLESDYIRPHHLADDHAGTVDVVLDALRWLKETQAYTPDILLLLQPTSPLRTSKDIDDAIDQFKQDNKNSLVSVHEMIEHPYECVQDIETDRWSYLSQQPANATRRQDYKKGFYYINGAIYLVNVDFLTKEKKFIKENGTSFYIMPSERGIDIDEPVDLCKAEVLLATLRNKQLVEKGAH